MHRVHIIKLLCKKIKTKLKRLILEAPSWKSVLGHYKTVLDTRWKAKKKVRSLLLSSLILHSLNSVFLHLASDPVVTGSEFFRNRTDQDKPCIIHWNVNIYIYKNKKIWKHYAGLSSCADFKTKTNSKLFPVSVRDPYLMFRCHSKWTLVNYWHHPFVPVWIKTSPVTNLRMVVLSPS